jgi:hypothetical protein
MASRLAVERVGVIQSGTYQAGDEIRFTLTRLNDNFLLRFDGAPEVYVLYVTQGSMGGRVLKYDFDRTALRVSGWGGMTIYTQKDPGGIPATRTGDATAPQLQPVSLADMIDTARKDSARIALTHHIQLDFDTNWNRLSSDARLRALCFDAMENAARGIERFAANAAGHRALAHHVKTVLIRTSGKPTIALDHSTLTVTYDPATGYVGRASSRAIASALHRLFRLPQTGN